MTTRDKILLSATAVMIGGSIVMWGVRWKNDRELIEALDACRTMEADVLLRTDTCDIIRTNHGTFGTLKRYHLVCGDAAFEITREDVLEAGARI